MLNNAVPLEQMRSMTHQSRDLTEAQWAILDTLIPKPAPRRDRRGRLWKDRRTVLNGILWVLRTGAPWAHVPDGKTVVRGGYRKSRAFYRAFSAPSWARSSLKIGFFFRCSGKCFS
jgi:transposase